MEGSARDRLGNCDCLCDPVVTSQLVCRCQGIDRRPSSLFHPTTTTSAFMHLLGPPCSVDEIDANRATAIMNLGPQHIYELTRH